MRKVSVSEPEPILNEDTLRTPSRESAEHDLGGAAPDIDHRNLALHRVPERPRRPDEREAALLLLAEDLHGQTAGPRRSRRPRRRGWRPPAPRPSRRSRIASASSSSASRTCVATTSATSVTFSGGSRRPSPEACPSRVNALWSMTPRSWPSSGSATSTRVVFEPMSIAAQSIREAILPEGARRAGDEGQARRSPPLIPWPGAQLPGRQRIAAYGHWPTGASNPRTSAHRHDRQRQPRGVPGPKWRVCWPGGVFWT